MSKNLQEIYRTIQNIGDLFHQSTRSFTCSLTGWNACKGNCPPLLSESLWTHLSLGNSKSLTCRLCQDHWWCADWKGLPWCSANWRLGQYWWRAITSSHFLTDSDRDCLHSKCNYIMSKELSRHTTLYTSIVNVIAILTGYIGLKGICPKF